MPACLRGIAWRVGRHEEESIMATKKAVKPRARSTAPSKKANQKRRAQGAPSSKQSASSRAQANGSSKQTNGTRPAKKLAGLRIHSITPAYTVNDLGKTIDWYCEGLGFTVSERWEDNGTLRGVMLTAGDCTFGVSQDDFAKGKNRKKGIGFRMYLSTTQDVDALAERVRAHGGKIIQEPTDSSWAKRSFAVEDPDGFKLNIDQAKK
jgi:uncharacterized glyoxalase superfamily protein PhnB